MVSSEPDEELARAIALSLQDSEPANDTTDLTTEDEDENEQLRRAIALSQQDPDPPSSHSADAITVLPREAALPSSEAAAHSREGTLTTSTTATPTTTNGLAGMDRKAMELARLARLGKRKRSISPTLPSKLVARTPSEPPLSTKAAATAAPSATGSLQYPRGVLKRTWAHKHPRSNDIKIEEVCQASNLKLAVLSAFQWDTKWVLSKINPYRIKQMWFMSAKEDWLREKMLKELKESGIQNLKPHFPPMNGQAVNMHSKLMLLVHEDYMRVVVPTANMIHVDWGETNVDANEVSWQSAVMENSLFLVDLPARPGREPAKTAESAFGKELLTFLRAQEAPRGVVDGLLKFDFKETGHLVFVHSIAGSHRDAAADGTGLGSLRKAIRTLKMDNVEKLELDYATSSLGALSEAFLKQLYLAASGLYPLGDKAVPDFLSRIRVYFPTADTVRNSTGGSDCGGIITFSRKHYHASTFPKQCLRDHKSTRPGVLSHNKMLLARGVRKDGSPFAWAYVGSANLTESAWGSHKILKSGKPGVLGIRNWESGVVMAVPEEKLSGLQLADGEVPDMSIFEGTVEVPFEFPGEVYGAKQPWFCNDYH